MFLKFFGKKKSKENSDDLSAAGLARGVDLDMNYCPRCEDEFRSDIDTCPGCLLPLVSGEERLQQVTAKEEQFNGRSMEISAEDELVVAKKGLLKDIKALQKILAAERIPSVIAGDENGCGKSCCGPEMYLHIKKEDTLLAGEVFARDFVKSTALNIDDLKNADVVFDEHAKETVCPACGCSFSPTVGACPECGLCFS